MEIRPVADGDLPAILGIINREIREGVAHFGTEEMTPEELETEWSATRQRYGWYCAVDGGALLGYARGGPWKTRGAYRWAAEIGVYIQPAAKGRGVGRALYEVLFDHLRAKGLRTLIAGITLPNAASVALHEKMGMNRVGVFERVGYKHGAWQSVGYWQVCFGGDEAPAR